MCSSLAGLISHTAKPFDREDLVSVQKDQPCIVYTGVRYNEYKMFVPWIGWRVRGSFNFKGAILLCVGVLEYDI
jgi:hypothetical protein